jgi:hypothetical protein
MTSFQKVRALARENDGTIYVASHGIATCRLVYDFASQPFYYYFCVSMIFSAIVLYLHNGKYIYIYNNMKDVLIQKVHTLKLKIVK